MRRYGYSVTYATNGKEALEVYNAEKDRIDLILLDLLMPKMDGAETLTNLKRIDPGVKVIICSGYGADKESIKDLVVTGVPMVNKPFQPDDLVATVRQVLDGRESIN